MPRRRETLRQDFSSTCNEETIIAGGQRSNAAMQEKLLHPDELKNLIPEFREGAGVTKWLSIIEHYALMYGWQDRTVLLYASCRLTGAAREWYNKFREVINTFAEFDRLIKKAFPDQRNEADILHELQQAVKNSGESYENYVFRVNAVGTNEGVNNAAVIVYIIRGLSHDLIYEYLVFRRYGDIYELLEHIKWCKTNLHHRRKKSGQQPGVSKPEARHMQIKPKDDIVCFNCNGSGHKSIHCPMLQRIQRCTICQRTGHTAVGCLKKVAAASVVPHYGPTPGQGPSRSSVNVIGFDEHLPEMEQSLHTDIDSRVKADIILGNELRKYNALVDSGSAVVIF